ncbi:hypothetical protein ACW9IK_28105 [Pseudomonas gingeri]|uniref:Uncharacterized protein n=1 Tax=Pseudomonas gingeri TaxID=117681 RepID=A0A7Y8CGL6_9PSED|nr:hypothetical protein [Pseudomonas gingeri]NWC17457.1 hypothetical protein [Pseudomonas gingeri]
MVNLTGEPEGSWVDGLHTRQAVRFPLEGKLRLERIADSITITLAKNDACQLYVGFAIALEAFNC